MSDTSLGVITAVVITIAATISSCALRANAHEWYEESCCHDEHCEEYYGDVIDKRTYYVIPEFDFVISKKDTRIRASQDSNYHLCKAVTEYNITFLCLYVPLWM